MQVAAKGPPNGAEAPAKALPDHGLVKRGSLGSTLEDADPLSPLEELQLLLRESRAADLEAFGVETHARIPCKPYRCGPWPLKEKHMQLLACKLQRREACSPAQAEVRETPRFSAEPRGPTKGTAKVGMGFSPGPAALQADASDPAATWASAASSSRRSRHAERRRPPARPLLDYSVDGSFFGPQTRCWGLEPFEVLRPDEHVGGPGGLRLSSADRSLLKQVGVEFSEKGNSDACELWMPPERERWRRTKRLRYLLKKGLLVFRDDYLRAEFEKDFLRFVGRPPKAREIPWGPSEVEDRVADTRASDASSSKLGGDTGDYSASLPWSYSFEVKHEASQPRENIPRVEAVSARSEERRAEDDLKLRPILENEVVRLHEASTGRLPSIFAGLRRSRREKHPKDVTVPFHRLKAYGEMIVQVTSCSMLQDRLVCCCWAAVAVLLALAECDAAQEVNNEMRLGWGQCARSSLLAEGTSTPKGVRDNPNYKVTPEKLRNAAAKLKVEIEQDNQDILAAAERRRRTVEPLRLLGGGRYAV
ncbi:hypothetical protein Esti_003589 [Eimeria stiedai]